MHFHKHTANKTKSRMRRKRRVRDSILTSDKRLRLSVFRSARHIYAQIIDDDKGVTVVSASSQEKTFSGKKGGNRGGAEAVGKTLAQRAKEHKIQAVAFDRGGYLYHGRVKALAEAARQGGLQF